MKRLLFLFPLALPLLSQSQTKVAPDCSLTFNFTAAGNSGNFDNRTISAATGVPCRYWTLSYYAQGFTGLSLTVQDAPDSSGSPGTFVTYAGTVVSGINPNTSLTGATTDLNGYYPWMRVNLGGLTGSGSVHGTLNGWRTDAATIGAASSSGCPGTTGSPCVVVGPTATGSAPTNAPVQTSAVDSAGNVVRFQNCTLQAQFDTSSSGNTLLVAASGATQIRVCRLSIEDTTGTAGASPTNTEQLVQGTGATCGGGTTNLWMAYVKVFAAAEDFALGPLIASASNAVCINLTNATRVTGAIQYAQY